LIGVRLASPRLIRLLLALIMLTGCGDDGYQLIVQVRTDLLPGTEFVTVRASLAEPSVTDVIPAVIGDDFITPVRLTELDALPAGSYDLVVTAADAAGAEIVHRTVRVDLRENLAVTVTLSRSCQGIVCPMAGNPASLTTCASGRCVDPTCSELATAACSPGDCTMDADCVSSSACAVGLCVEGGCLFAADDSACSTGEICSPTVGCVTVDPPLDAGMDTGADAGMDAGDTSVPDAADTAVDTTVDTRPGCTSEVVLADTVPRRHQGGYGGLYSTLTVVIASRIGGQVIGDEDPLADGYTGAAQFRVGDDAHFDAVVGPWMDGSETSVGSAVTPGGIGGSFTPTSLSGPVRDTIITMVRRSVTSMSVTPDGAGGTDYDVTVAWQLFGCRPGE